MEENRKNWIAELNNGRYIVVDKTTGTMKGTGSVISAIDKTYSKNKNGRDAKS